MKITANNLLLFNAVMAYCRLDADEIELCKAAYRADPVAAAVTYAALATEIPAPIDDRVWVKLSAPPFTGEIK